MRSCDWNDHGANCDRAGFLSLCTNGAGPWYCRDHFADLMRWPRWNPLQAGTSPVIGEIKQAMKGARTREKGPPVEPRRQPGEDIDQETGEITKHDDQPGTAQDSFVDDFEDDTECPV